MYHIMQIYLQYMNYNYTLHFTVLVFVAEQRSHNYLLFESQKFAQSITVL